ncbi:MAG: hypothetical protein AB7H66_04245 [Hyphomonadaceae bacterium]
MRTHIIAALLLASATGAFAQDEQNVIAPPATAAPSAAAPIDRRVAWCEEYATWLVAMTQTGDPTPADVRQTHRLEVELNSCTIDPQGYERQTRVEAQRAVEIANG